ncbi:hypothetical protein FVEN_g9539 [Fusarium venenatum]|uniref:Trichothecene 3-O-acetyltransferase n=1 Tax=Fusarium venenatum TaxID=56646 RepID=A0A2L2TCQ2_9HYPO|nr:uncharacterized protein FVRRES_04241 [Fusarium venenatum]KAG8352402.1 hypothetical protein FVEN_g9539 [Fusarium venenatum]KAH7002807.1 hypothetical protein EDB82DRAFT_425168 [Fusarium venenatum]CEI67729.1 unnamed protein product [Fusarium venenatum]
MDRQILSSSWVEPVGFVRPATIELSALDNLTASVYPTPTKFFPLMPEADPIQLYDDCKRGLARYLYQCPIFCGKIIKHETGRMSVDIPPAPYAGAKFEYYDHRNDKEIPSYDEFRSFGWPFADGNKDGLKKLCPDNFPTTETGDPVIIPRFNVIRGGIVLMMSATHATGDLVQFIDFMKNWAAHTRSVSNARLSNQPEPPAPEQVAAHLMDRSPMMPNVPNEPDLDKVASRAENIPHWTMLDPRDPEKMGDTLQTLFTTARLTDHDLVNYTEGALREPSVSVWVFPKSSVESLRDMAQKASAGLSKLSIVDCLTAFTWQCFFVAKWAPGQSGQQTVPDMSRIVYLGSVRSRLASPLPLDYMPACVDVFTVDVETRVFASLSPESLAKTAANIRDSNRNWDERRFCDMLEVAQMHPMNPGIVPEGPLDALATDHTRLSAAVLENWGPGLGQCEAFREPYLGRVPPPGEITLLPRCNNGDIGVMFAGEAAVLERLRDNEDLNAMASCQFIMHDFAKMASKCRKASKL